MPEAKNIRWLNDQFNPVAALDMHHQGTRVHDGKMITASTLWPTASATATRLLAVDANAVTRFNAGVDMAKRVVVIIAETLAQYPYAGLSRYPGGTEPGISRNAYGLLGSGSVLLKLRGGIGTKRADTSRRSATTPRWRSWRGSRRARRSRMSTRPAPNSSSSLPTRRRRTRARANRSSTASSTGRRTTRTITIQLIFQM